MKVRSIANGSILDLAEGQVRGLIDAGIYEEVVESEDARITTPEPKPKAEPKRKTAKALKDPKEKKKTPGEYRRRDMQAEK